MTRGSKSEWDWLTLLAFARVDLGLSEEEFWRLTPAQFFAYSERKNAQLQREDFRAAVMTLTLRRVHGDRNAKLDDFFPSLKESRRSDTPAQIRQSFRAIIEEQQKRKSK